MSLTAQIVARSLLPAQTAEEMLALHQRHFDGVERMRFFTDLEEKDWVILLLAADGRLAGFSTQKLLSPVEELGGARFLFSGDTIVERAHANTPLLPGCFGHLMLRLMEQYGEESLYWFLISKGFRTYRFLPVFFERFWPSSDHATPQAAQRLIDAVARRKFGPAYDATSGLVRIAETDRLAPSLAQIPPGRLDDRHVAFFLARNPGYARGDELACLAPIRRDNLNSYGRRVIRSTHPIWVC
ncbi:MAG TPA: hypothetical protein PK322_00365 [Opitutaceae bacterium]|nr:hypothetical protein [Opitutaceae bacterium]